ncbi:MAG: DHH family phosphoesterase [Deltaproteobacteria bacterium]
MSLEKVVKIIRERRSFLVTVHTNLDGDALGSELAFARLLKKLGKTALCVNDDHIPYGYDFLPGVGSIRQYRQGMKLPRFDCAAVLDCSDMSRTGQVNTLDLSGVPVINIDHHVSNAGFGTVNWVDPGACCSCELVFRLFKRMRVRIDRQAALALYTGILTDTGSFRYSNTRPCTHQMASELLATGIDASAVYKKIYSSVPYDDMKLLSRILPTMQKDPRGKVIWFELPKELLEGRGAVSFDLSESILNFARSVKGVEVVVLFKENMTPHSGVRVNFRSQGKADVNRIAGIFGGGGHRTAAGATFHDKTIDQVKRRVLDAVQSEIARS